MGLDPTSVIGWVAWLVFFLVWEGRGLYENHKAGKDVGTTLSEFVWSMFATKKLGQPVTGWVRLRRFILLAFMAWLTVHFMSGGQWA